MRSAASDFFYNSWRLVPANALLALAVIVVLASWPLVGSGLALVLAPLVAFPLSGLFRLAGLIARGHDAVLSDVWSSWRSTWRETLGLGVAFTVASLVFTTNVLVGVAIGQGPSMLIAVMAAWGLLGTWVYGLLAWPILTDPERVGKSMRDRLRLAGLLAIAFPLRLVGFALLVALFLTVSTALFAAVVTVSLAFAALVACRYVLPAADRFSDRSGVAASSATRD